MNSALEDVLKASHLAREAQQAAVEAIANRGAMIRAALESGVSAVELAKALGVNRQRVYAMAKK